MTQIQEITAGRTKYFLYFYLLLHTGLPVCFGQKRCKKHHIFNKIRQKNIEKFKKRFFQNSRANDTCNRLNSPDNIISYNIINCFLIEFQCTQICQDLFNPIMLRIDKIYEF